MGKINLLKKLAMGTLMSIAILGSTASAANYKFAFNVTTKVLHGAAYSAYAVKYTQNENPVLKVTQNTSAVKFDYVVVNSDNKTRTDTISTKQTGKWNFVNHATQKGYKYRLRVQTDVGKIWNTYTVKGAWNIDTY